MLTLGALDRSSVCKERTMHKLSQNPTISSVPSLLLPYSKLTPSASIR
jgi:hypothetical protein